MLNPFVTAYSDYVQRMTFFDNRYMFWKFWWALVDLQVFSIAEMTIDVITLSLSLCIITASCYMNRCKKACPFATFVNIV